MTHLRKSVNLKLLINFSILSLIKLHGFTLKVYQTFLFLIQLYIRTGPTENLPNVSQIV